MLFEKNSLDFANVLKTKERLRCLFLFTSLHVMIDNFETLTLMCFQIYASNSFCLFPLTVNKVVSFSCLCLGLCVVLYVFLGLNVFLFMSVCVSARVFVCVYHRVQKHRRRQNTVTRYETARNDQFRFWAKNISKVAFDYFTLT